MQAWGPFMTVRAPRRLYQQDQTVMPTYRPS